MVPGIRFRVVPRKAIGKGMRAWKFHVTVSGILTLVYDGTVRHLEYSTPPKYTTVSNDYFVDTLD